MKMILAILTLALLSGCQSALDARAKAWADHSAAQVAAAQGRAAALAALEATKDLRQQHTP